MITWTTWTIPTTKWYAADYLTWPTSSGCFVFQHQIKPSRLPQRKALIVLFQRWFSVAAEETSVPGDLAAYLREVRKATPTLLAFLVNLADDNGNTVLHYSVSHCNYGIVGLLLETGDAGLSCPETNVYTQTLSFPLDPFRSMRCQSSEQCWLYGRYACRADGTRWSGGNGSGPQADGDGKHSHSLQAGRTWAAIAVKVTRK